MDIEIRPARLEDAGVLTELSMRSKRSNGYDEYIMAACRKEPTVTDERFIEGEYWVAESGVVCGCACLLADPNSRSGEVHAFFIAPEWQRRGIGRSLWQKPIERARAKKLVTLHLDADPSAVLFYEALGLKMAGEVSSGSVAGPSFLHTTIAIDRCD